MPDTPLRPSDLIATSEALGELLARDPLIAAWRAWRDAGEPYFTVPKPKAKLSKVQKQGNALYLQAENRQKALIGDVLEALRDGKLEAFPVNVAGGRQSPAVSAYWDDVRGTVSLLRRPVARECRRPY
jgi:hypothetical protein